MAEMPAGAEPTTIWSHLAAAMRAVILEPFDIFHRFVRRAPGQILGLARTAGIAPIGRGRRKLRNSVKHLTLHDVLEGITKKLNFKPQRDLNHYRVDKVEGLWK